MTKVKHAIDRLRLSLDEKDAQIARLNAEASPLREAIGLLSTLHPQMVMDPANPVGMAQEIHAHVTEEQVRLKAEVKRLTPPCGRCKGERTTTPTGNTPCPNCDGTGRAR